MCDNLVKSRALVCTENSDSHVMVMQSAEERMRGDAPDPLNRAHRLRDDPTGSGTLRSAPPRHRRFGGRVRGFAPAGIGPRDLTQFPFTGVLGDALGGSYYWGASLELQTPLYFLPKDTGIKVAAFADAGSLWNYTGPTTFPRPARSSRVVSVRPSVRASPTRCRVRWTTPCMCAARWAWE